MIVLWVAGLWRGLKEKEDALGTLNFLQATRKWKIEEGQYRDDITAIVVFLPVSLRFMSKMHGKSMCQILGLLYGVSSCLLYEPHHFHIIRLI